MYDSWLKDFHCFAVAEPLYGLSYPQRRYLAQHFNCSSPTEGLGSCNYDSIIDTQCYVGPHVAGVRCIESKNFNNPNTLSNYQNVQWCYIIVHTAPPLRVQGLCSSVVWYSPEVPCEDVHGYEVRLFHLHLAHQNVTSRVGANGTFYVVDEEQLVSSDETYVQVL